MIQGTRAANAPWRLTAGVGVAVAAVVLFRFMVGETYDLPKAAQRAETYLRERGTDLDPGMLLILDYLDRRFSLPWVRPAIARLRELQHPGSHIPAAFARLIDPTARLTPEQIAALPNTLDSFTAMGLYCTTNGLPTTFLPDVERRLLKDDYDPPHAALGLQWAIEQGCLDPRAADVTALRQRVLDGLVQVAGGVPQDRAIEAIAMLAYLGAWERVQPKWLQTIAAAQQHVGAWSEPGQPFLNDHTTTLALWVLLEATREGKAVRWVVQEPPGVSGRSSR
jgi:hypothetical protein